MERKNLTKNGIIDITLASIREANALYEEISGGWWLPHAPEYFLTTAIGTHIHRNFNTYVYFDASLKKIWEKENGVKLEECEITSRRPDISVWKRDSSDLYCCIEVKNSYLNSGVSVDIGRIEELVKNNYCKFGIAVSIFCSFRDEKMKWSEKERHILAEKHYIERAEKIVINSKIECEYKVYVSKETDRDGYKWAAIAFLVT